MRKKINHEKLKVEVGYLQVHLSNLESTRRLLLPFGAVLLVLFLSVFITKNLSLHAFIGAGVLGLIVEICILVVFFNVDKKIKETHKQIAQKINEF